MLLQISLLLTLTILITSCASDIDYRIPLNQFESPETNGKLFAFEGSVGLQSDRKITLNRVIDYTALGLNSTTIDNSKKVSPSTSPYLGLSLGLHERIDIGLSTSYDAIKLLQVKMQLLGLPHDKKDIGTKLALLFGYGASELSEGSYQTTNESNQTRSTYNATINGRSKKMAVILGHRFTETLLIYLSQAISQTSVDATMKLNNTTTNYKNSSSQNLSLVGVELGQKAKLRLEGGYSTFEFDSDLPHDHAWFYGGSLAIRF